MEDRDVTLERIWLIKGGQKRSFSVARLVSGYPPRFFSQSRQLPFRQTAIRYRNQFLTESASERLPGALEGSQRSFHHTAKSVPFDTAVFRMYSWGF